VAEKVAVVNIKKSQVTSKKSQELFLDNAANEIFFGVVGHVGSGTSEVAKTLHDLLEDDSLPGGAFDVEILKARDIIKIWAKENGHALPEDNSADLDDVTKLQDYGDLMRKENTDYTAVARGLILRVRETRADKKGEESDSDIPILPDGKRRAYILDSIRHPAEVLLLRRIYQEAFALVGVVCEEEVRLRRIEKKYDNAGERRAKEFMKRDSKATEKFGQRVSDAFHLSDFFLDNSLEKKHADGSANEDWTINEDLSRFIKIISHAEIVRPKSDETAMYHAYGAQMRSACLSRQVGAALVSKEGNVVAVGSNEVPRAGGGVYGEGFDASKDERCAYKAIAGVEPYCSNTKEQNKIIDDLIEKIPELSKVDDERKKILIKELRDSKIGSLIEFSRAVHAEMDAILTATRQGVSTIGCRLFVTTFPCHYCARHIVTTGIDEVQFIEPYLKSKALDLHHDSIQKKITDWKAPSDGGERVLFRPFTGVAPRLYRRAFLKDRDLKDNDTGTFKISAPEWGSPWHLSGTSYVQLEAELKKND